MGTLHRIGKFYSRIIMKNIGICIFAGLLFVVFQDGGWCSSEDIYAISQLAYTVVLPVMIAYEGGKEISGYGGGLLAVLAVCGVAVSGPSISILGAMVLGPGLGWVWKQEEAFLERNVSSKMQMLGRNLCLGMSGAVFAVVSGSFLLPMLKGITAVIYQAVDFLIQHHLTGALSILIEPAKVFFFNNVINHAILTPMGVSQVQETGRSVLFLLESNPGPGFGVLAALYYVNQKKRGDYAAAMIAQAAGGIHEVYFPFVLSDLRLLLPLIAGGIAGNLCFGLWGAGLQGVVSPGSIFSILLMTGGERILPVLGGILVSAGISFGGSLAVLRRERREELEPEEEKQMEKRGEIKKIAFVCDGGMGSSAMAAALFRRALKRAGIEGIQVSAFAADLVPEDQELLVCQKDFYRMLPEKMKEREIYLLDNLIQAEQYTGLVEEIQKRNR